MGIKLDELIESIANSTSETPQVVLKSWLDQLYADSSRVGLTSPQLVLLIRFLCESPVLSLSTKLYITENCLITNDYISRDVPREIARHLGTANAISEFRIQTPLKIQVALCKWLAQIYFLLVPQFGQIESVKESDIWIHLWQFGYLQHWLTYIMVWSSVSVSDVKPWKVTLLRRVASKASYQYGAANATLILLRYATLVGQSKLISDSISSLKCNARKLRTLQSFKIDEDFLRQLQILLIRKSPSHFTSEIISELVSSQLGQLQVSENGLKNNLSRGMIRMDRVFLQSIRSSRELVWHWNYIIEPKDFDYFFSSHATIPQLLYILQLEDDGKTQSTVWKWISINLNMIFNSNADDMWTARSIIDGIIRFCQVNGAFTEAIISDFLTLKNLKSNSKIFAYLWSKIFLLSTFRNFHVGQYQQQILQILAYCHLDRCKRVTVFPRVCNSLIDFIRNRSKSTTKGENSSILEIVQFILTLLPTPFSNVPEDRAITLLTMNILKTLPQMTDGIKIMSPRTLNIFFIADDPLLLDATCRYLINSKDSLLDLESENKFVKYQNQFIMDLTNLLWRNKLLSSKRFIGIPVEFLRSILDSLYLPNTESNTKIFFSITGIPALSYASIVKLREIETRNNTSVSYRGLIMEEGVKRFRTKNHDNASWLLSVKNVRDLKVELLKELANLGPYRNIPLFLFTYLKSLSQYKNNA